MLAEAEDGLPLDTVQVYSPPSLPATVTVWVYCAVTGSFNTVCVPWVTVVESLVQVTVVAGPPVEIQVSVNLSSESKVKFTPPDSVTIPAPISHWKEQLQIISSITSFTVVKTHIDHLIVGCTILQYTPIYSFCWSFTLPP